MCVMSLLLCLSPVLAHVVEEERGRIRMKNNVEDGLYFDLDLDDLDLAWFVVVVDFPVIKIVDSFFVACCWRVTNFQILVKRGCVAIDTM